MRKAISLGQRYGASFAVYVLIGGTAALVEWASFYVALSSFTLHYVPASICGFATATYVNYVLSARIGFRRGRRSAWSEIALVYGVSAVGLVINILVMVAVMELTALPVMLGKVGGTGIAFIWNFAARQFCVFDKEPRWAMGGKREATIPEA
ncbi:GtrA family protein [Skermanella rosea]|uniref:GtrA family protein n=1 Tax=Skermanella rosea TaxID=1817965 RepID=UPI00193280C9|nr:GtrA family protein [Skermanella rosea]UEM01402.1 GtrA family protein [Skermanella rosea]